MQLNPERNKDYTVTPTVDTTKITITGDITCCVKNGICYVSIRNCTFANAGNNQANVITGLPKSALQVSALLSGSSASETALVSAAGTGCWINPNDTVLNFHVGTGDDTRRHWLSLSYPVAD